MITPKRAQASLCCVIDPGAPPSLAPKREAQATLPEVLQQVNGPSALQSIAQPWPGGWSLFLQDYRSALLSITPQRDRQANSSDAVVGVPGY